MQRLSIKDLWQGTIAARGALDVDARGDAVSPRRLPAWTRLQVPPLMDTMVRMPSGVRLRFETESPRIGLSFHATNMVTPPAERRHIGFNLETGGALFDARSTKGNTIVLNRERPGEFTLERGEPDTVSFEGLPSERKVCELWLPQKRVRLAGRAADRCGRHARDSAGGRETALGALWQLDQPLHGGGPTGADLAGGSGAHRRCEPAEPGVRR